MYNQIRRHKMRYFCVQNFKKFLQNSTLHGLRFIGDESITIWERLFFLFAFGAALIPTGHLISYIYSKWSLTPIIIATDPFPTAIVDIPFPAVTICNMNQLLRSKVNNYSKTSNEYAIMKMACFDQNNNNKFDMPPYYENNSLSITQFMTQHSQPCSDMILNCQFNALQYNCTDLFREVLTDEGICCVFNYLHPKFRLKTARITSYEYTNFSGHVPVDWNPEIGYEKQLPDEIYPRASDGIGVSMGLTVILNAQVDDYYCSSTNGPGFKLDFHSPVELAQVRDIGLTIPPGHDTRFTVIPRSTSAMPNTRAFRRSVRNCIFNDESKLIVYRYYTQRNCENECQAQYILRICKCIPYNLPPIVQNASTCGAPKSFCMNKARKTWLRSKSACRKSCLKSCFDLKYLLNSFTAPLKQGDFKIMNFQKLENFSLEYIRNNIAIVSVFYNEYVFYGDVRNVYVGFNEFLSSIGGILGLFLGFSFISLIEVFYYGIMLPISWWIRPKNRNQAKGIVAFVRNSTENINSTIRNNTKMFSTKQKNIRKRWLVHEHYKKEKLQDQYKEMSRRKNFKKHPTENNMNTPWNII